VGGDVIYKLNRRTPWKRGKPWGFMELIPGPKVGAKLVIRLGRVKGGPGDLRTNPRKKKGTPEQPEEKKKSKH